MAEKNITGFTRDPNLSSDIADQFGQNSARAEQLIQANTLRYTDELNAANLLPEDLEARGKYENGDVESAADLPEGSVKGCTKRGDYLVYVYVLDGRPGKDVLLIDGDSLEQPDTKDTPERAALRAAVGAQNKVREAQGEAEKIVAKAKEEAAQIVAEAAAKAEEERAEEAQESAERIQQQDEPPKPEVNAAKSGQRTPGRKPSAAQEKDSDKG